MKAENKVELASHSNVLSALPPLVAHSSPSSTKHPSKYDQGRRKARADTWPRSRLGHCPTQLRWSVKNAELWGQRGCGPAFHTFSLIKTNKDFGLTTLQR